MFILPSWVRDRIDKIQKRFLWKDLSHPCKGYHHVSWGKVCKPQEQGGLRVKNLRTMNITLISKWWWNLQTHSEGMLTKLIWSKYGPRRGSWATKPRNNCNLSAFWRNVRSMFPMFSHEVRYKIGRGQQTVF